MPFVCNYWKPDICVAFFVAPLFRWHRPHLPSHSHPRHCIVLRAPTLFVFLLDTLCLQFLVAYDNLATLLGVDCVAHRWIVRVAASVYACRPVTAIHSFVVAHEYLLWDLNL